MVVVTVVCVLRWQGWQKFFLLLCNCFLKLCLIRVNKVWTYLVACVMYMLTAYGLLNVSHSFSFFFFCLFVILLLFLLQVVMQVVCFELL